MTSTAEASAVRDAVRSLPIDSLPLDGTWRTVSTLGLDATLYYRLDKREDQRRRREGMDALIDINQLDLMLSLPVGVPIPLTSLTRRERVTLKGTPSAAAEVIDEQVVRRAVTPLSAELAVVSARGWRRGLEAAGRFAPYCPRAMLLRSRPRNLDHLTMEAAFYGIGVILADGQTSEVVVPPRPFRRMRFTPSAWQFNEEVYRHSR